MRVQELQHDKNALQQQVLEQANHISQLKSQVEGGRFNADLHDQYSDLTEQLRVEREASENKEKEVSVTYISQVTIGVPVRNTSSSKCQHTVANVWSVCT
jgi:hypothetical protein